MSLPSDVVARLTAAVNRQRLLDTALALVAVPSPTLSAGAVADRLAGILAGDGFTVERPEANWPEAPAVVVRWATGRPGRTLQFDGHLDTVHLPFVPPRVEDGLLFGSGASDMKGGIAAFVEALRVLKETGALSAGGVLLTAHDHHEGPWGDRRQVLALIEQGCVGDAVLLPEYLADRLPIAGRGMAIFEAVIRREGQPAHEVMRPYQEPNVLDAGAELVVRLRDKRHRLCLDVHPQAGTDAVFVGKIACGEIYNQHPVECRVQGTRRWITPGSVDQVRRDFHATLDRLAADTGTTVSADFAVQGDAFRIDPSDPLVGAFQAAYRAVTGQTLPVGGKAFVDDGNTFAPRAGIPALTHGPDAKGAHTLEERVPVDELVRIARVYALTAVAYCVATNGRT